MRGSFLITFAISLANDIISNSRYEKWSLNSDEKDSLRINSIRNGNTIGIHDIYFKSSLDQIKISHESFSRSSYAIGALIASVGLAYPGPQQELSLILLSSAMSIGIKVSTTKSFVYCPLVI